MKRSQRGSFGPESSLTQSLERQRKHTTFFTQAFLLQKILLSYYQEAIHWPQRQNFNNFNNSLSSWLKMLKATSNPMVFKGESEFACFEERDLMIGPICYVLNIHGRAIPHRQHVMASEWLCVYTDCLHIGSCHLRVQAGISSWRSEDAKYKISCPKEGLKVIVHILQRGEVMMKTELNLNV